MNRLKKISFTIVCILVSAYSFANQMAPAVQEPVDFMRSNGKIYVVMAVVCTIVVGLLIYLINLDKKIGQLEKKFKD